MKVYYAFALYSTFCLLGNADGDLKFLRQQLLKGYDSHSRPVTNHSKLTNIKLGLSFNSINLNENAQTMTINGWLGLVWQDDFLVWDPEEYNEIYDIHFARDEIWTPDITLHNTKNVDILSQIKKIPLLVEHTGRVVWVPSFSGEVPCKMNLYRWPSDSHVCSFVFGSWTHYKIDMQLLSNNKSKAYTLQNYVRNSKWKLVNVSTTQNYPYYDDMYPVISVNAVVQRRSGKYAMYVLHSSFDLVLVVISSYVLPFNSHLLKIVFHLVSSFLLIIGLLAFYFIIPSTGGPLPQIVILYSGIVIITIISLIFTIAMSSLLMLLPFYYSDSWKGKVSRDIMQFLSTSPTLHHVVESDVLYAQSEPELMNESEFALQNSTSALHKSALIVLRTLNVLVCLTLVLAYLSIYFMMKSNFNNR